MNNKVTKTKNYKFTLLALSKFEVIANNGKLIIQNNFLLQKMIDGWPKRLTISNCQS